MAARRNTHWTIDFLPHFLGSLFIGLVLVTPVNTGGVGSHMLMKEAFASIYVFGFAFCYFCLPPNSKLRYSTHPLVIALVLLFAWGCVSIAWAANTDFAIVNGLRWLTGLWIAILAFQLQKPDELRTVLKYLFAAGLFVAALADLQFLTGFSAIPQFAVPAATFANKNMATHIVVLTWLTGPVLLMSARQPSPLAQYYYVVGTALALTFLVYAQTRSAAIAVCMQALVWALYFVISRARFGAAATEDVTLPSRKPLATGLLLFALLINLDDSGFHPVYLDAGARLSEIGEMAERTGGAKIHDRYQIWKSTLDVFKDHPVLGAGIGSFEAVYPDYAPRRVITIRRAHNDYVQTLAELGVVGGLLLGGVIAVLFAMGVRAGLARPTPVTRLELLLLTSFAGIIVASIVSFPMQLIGPTVICSAYFGMLLRLRAMQTATQEVLIATPSRAALGVVLCTLLVSSAWLNYDWMSRIELMNRQIKLNSWKGTIDLRSTVTHPMYNYCIRLITQAYIDKHPDKAEQVARSYYKLHPDDVVINNLLAQALMGQRRFDAAQRVIEQTRPMEPPGNYRSYELELAIAGVRGDKARMAAIIDTLMAEPPDLLLAEPALPRNLAVAMIGIEQPQRAEALLADLLSIYPNHEPSLKVMVNLQEGLGAPDKAGIYLERIKALNAIQATDAVQPES